MSQMEMVINENNELVVDETPAQSKGLYDKFTVIDNRTGEVVRTPVFVLRPDKDPVAWDALLAYSSFTSNDELRKDLIKWITSIKRPEV